MGNHIMEVDFFGNGVRCETADSMVNLTDLFNAGNAYRLQRKKSAAQLASFTASKGFAEYHAAAAAEWGVEPSDMLVTTRGNNKNSSRTMVHIALALYAAEYLSPEFHARMHRELVEGRLLQFRVQGGTEFGKLNSIIDKHLPNREGKSNTGIYIQVAKLIRSKVTGLNDPDGNVWNSATALQQQERTSIEVWLSKTLIQGLIRDYDHLKEVITKW